MKTITYTRGINSKPITSNPFVVVSNELKILFQGHSAIISTGLTMELYEDIVPVIVENIRPDICVVSVMVINKEIKIVVITEGDADIYFIKPGDELAKIKLINVIEDRIRFVDFTGGKRSVYSDAVKPNDNKQ